MKLLIVNDDDFVAGDGITGNLDRLREADVVILHDTYDHSYEVVKSTLVSEITVEVLK